MRENTLYNVEYKLSNNNNYYSFFNLSNTPDFLAIQNTEIAKNAFSNFVNSRKSYLNNLRNLGDNWISGISVQPTDGSIDSAVNFLENFNIWYNFNSGQKIIPKIIMGPTPSGGIGMEIKISESLKMYLTILNENYSCEIESDGYFREQQVDKNNALNTIVNLYTQYERGYHSERRNPI